MSALEDAADLAKRLRAENPEKSTSDLTKLFEAQMTEEMKDAVLDEMFWQLYLSTRRRPQGDPH
jgi:hypothetical protein